MMGSRSGSVDPGLLLHLLTSNAYQAAELDSILNTASGLKGVSQVSEDIRDVIAAAAGGAVQSQLALDMYAHRLSAGIAAMAAAAGGIDALAFTAGRAALRLRARARLCAARISRIALAVPENNSADDREISSPQSQCAS